ncbi:MAG: exonuclease domain-containing protein [bacterium]|nr:exonuclease domain-containing protein [bacterium]MDE0602026.1 exonuclease domain-containing protein [bacterium]
MMRPPANKARIAVVDTETTGFYRTDRIVEFACVTILDGEIVEEYETLLQPNRDPGPVNIHGITPSMLEAAPEFDWVAGDIAARLNGAVIVAHHINFDLRMLAQEIRRVPTMVFDPGVGICTYRLTNQKLSVAAQQAGIGQPDHTALGDARVSAQLLLTRSSQWADGNFSSATCRSNIDSTGLTVRRPGAPPRRGALSMLALRTAWPRTTNEAEVLYLDTLDRCLDDGELSHEEQVWLNSTARALQLSEGHRVEMHQRYYERLVKQILADGVVTREERALHDKVAAALAIDGDERIGEETETDEKKVVKLTPGMAVCFTGAAMVDGDPIPRPTLENLARQVGLHPVKSVTKRCGLVVAGDVRSRSGKARKARDLGLPMIDATHFITLIARGASR